MEKYKLPAWQLMCHALSIYAITIFTPIDYAVSIAMYFVVGCLGVTVTYHRYLTHRSFETNKWIVRLFTLFGTLGGQGSSIGWVGLHREHHRHSDTEKDPHSPKFGILKSFYGSAFKRPKVAYVTDLLRDKFQVLMHEFYWPINLAWATILLLVGGFKLWLMVHVVPSFILWNTASSVNVLGHMWGYRNYPDTREDSKNNWLSALLAWGEGWHNNHHGDPKNYSFQKKWWEFDISKQVIRLIKQ